MRKLFAVLVSCLGIALMQNASAQDKVIKIGAIYPLSGALASTGIELKNAVELAADIVNKEHPELKGILIAAGAGLPGLDGAKIEDIFADSQGKPSLGKDEAQLTHEHEPVVELVGAQPSSGPKKAPR